VPFAGGARAARRQSQSFYETRARPAAAVAGLRASDDMSVITKRPSSCEDRLPDAGQLAGARAQDPGALAGDKLFQRLRSESKGRPKFHPP